jgi:hypothetical protein
MQVTRNENGFKAVRIRASYADSDQRTNPVNRMDFLNSTGAVHLRFDFTHGNFEEVPAFSSYRYVQKLDADFDKVKLTHLDGE